MELFKTSILFFSVTNTIVFSSAGWAKSAPSVSTHHRDVESPKMTHIHSSDAIKAAVAKVPGDVHSIAVENKKNSMVYEVEIVNAASELHEVRVDGGDGKVLSDRKENQTSSNAAKGN